MNIQQHRPTKPGPEAVLMDAVATWSRCIVDDEKPYWAASSIPVGAGMPDLILATYRPELCQLVSPSDDDARVLAYLRLVRSANVETLSEALGCSLKRLTKTTANLLDAEAIKLKGSAYSLTTKWRHILPTTVAVEGKIFDWKKAVEQAARNSIFSNYSYVALPCTLASHVCLNSVFGRLGLGLLGVEKTGDVRILRQARWTKTIAWYYYYNLAFTLCRTDELRRCPSKCPSM